VEFRPRLGIFVDEQQSIVAAPLLGPFETTQETLIVVANDLSTSLNGEGLTDEILTPSLAQEASAGILLKNLGNGRNLRRLAF